MKKLSASILVILITASVSLAQHGHNMERIHAAKMAYISDRMKLSYQQSGNFVPLYNDYERELRGIRQSFFQKYKGADRGNMDDATSRQFIDDDLDYQQQVIELKRRYNDQFLKVIAPWQLTELYKAEREFKQKLVKLYLEQRRNGPPGRFR